MKEKFICGLDIGTAKLCATCGTIDSSGKIDILASQTISTQGLRAGRIIDSKKLSTRIREVTERLRRMFGIKVRRVYANIDSPDLRAEVHEKKVSFEEKTKVKESHIDNLINSTISSNIPLDRKIIHTSFYPQDRSPYELKLNIAIVSAFIPTINSFIKCVRDAGLILKDMVPSGCAQALGLFRDFERNAEKNYILIDIGAGLTKITFFKDKLVKNIIILPQGAQSITEDIASKLKVSIDCAEQLKIKYGRISCKNHLLNQKLIIKDKLINRIIQPQYLYEVITSKADHLLREIKKALLELNYEDKKVTEIIVTGGGSILEGFLERAEKVLAKSVKMGFLSGVKDNHIQAQSALYATSIGLIHFGFKNRNKKNPLLRGKLNPIMHTLNRAKKLYYEYF